MRDLFGAVLRLRLRDSVERVVADIRRPLGRGLFDTAGIGRIGAIRLITAGPAPTSHHRMSIDTAELVTRVLDRSGVATFVTGREGDRIRVGIGHVDRAPALEALNGALVDGTWFIEWADRGRTGIEPLPCRRSRRVALAREWNVFRAHQWGEHAIGPRTGVEISFWQTGSSRMIERVGTRGQERFDTRTPETVECIDGRTFNGRTAFPIQHSLEFMTDPVDFVFTWVDGDDPSWRERFLETAKACGRDVAESALDPARYNSRDELRYALRSIWTYCGWVNHVWIVTSGQRPAWLDDTAAAHGVTIVDHSEILPADALPTFNSHAIEAALHHIDGLAEHFVYFNDDMFVRRPLRPELFFTANGLPFVFQSDARVVGFEDGSTPAVDAAARRGRELLDRRFGKYVTHKAFHVPYPQRRSVLNDIECEFPVEIARTQRSRFRSPGDVSLAASFAPHYGLATRQAVLGTVSSHYAHVESGRLRWHLDRIRLGDDIDTYCINETGRTDGDLTELEAQIGDFFEACLPIAAPWERGPACRTE